MHVSEFLSHDHRACDRHFSVVENALMKADWAQAGKGLESFAASTLHHFQLEEEILFPNLEDAMNQRGGPTEIMRMEHGEIRQLIDELQQAVAAQNMEAVTGTSDILIILLQQHNTKEEQILYPMIDRFLGDQAKELLGQLKINI